LEVGGWRFEVGGSRFEVGGSRFEVGGSRLKSLKVDRNVSLFLLLGLYSKLPDNTIAP